MLHDLFRAIGRDGAPLSLRIIATLSFMIVPGTRSRMQNIGIAIPFKLDFSTMNTCTLQRIWNFSYHITGLIIMDNYPQRLRLLLLSLKCFLNLLHILYAKLSLRLKLKYPALLVLLVLFFFWKWDRWSLLVVCPVNSGMVLCNVLGFDKLRSCSLEIHFSSPIRQRFLSSFINSYAQTEGLLICDYSS